MESRNYIQLYSDVQHFYNQNNVNSLRGYLQLNRGGYSELIQNPSTPYPSFSILYNQGSFFEHEITIRIPGFYTFGRRLQYKTIDKFDFSVGYSTSNNSIKVELTHLSIARDLYDKVKNNVNLYGDFANILRNLYYDVFPLQGTSFNQNNISNQNFQGLSIPAMVSNIKWISLQEDINHPAPSWGKKLSFCRYFEAIYAALYNIPFENVSIRIGNRNNPRPKLWQDYVYHIQI